MRHADKGEDEIVTTVVAITMVTVITETVIMIQTVVTMSTGIKELNMTMTFMLTTRAMT